MDVMTQTPIHIIGGGMAGSEAAWQAANAGAKVVLHEMRGVRGTEAHQTDGLAELVCSNSFRSDDHETNAVGLLHEEMRRAGSIIMEKAKIAQVPAGGALAVDRDVFSQAVTAAIEAHPNITIVREEIAGLPPEGWDSVIIATGPLTSTGLAEAIHGLTGEGELAFFDAIAPILYADSIDMDVAWKQSRYDKGDTEEDKAAYINCPMDKEQYEAFIDALVSSEKTEFKDWEKDTPYFDGCLPIEVMAERGRETLRHGPMKPRGLTNAHNPDEKPYAVVQLRQDNALGTLFNMVGFQTKMKYGVQTDVFKMIPGLENARFARLGGIHRNTFLHSPKLLDGVMRLKARPSLRFAGQITGVEGYVESAAMGLLAGRFAAAEKLGLSMEPPPPTTALGALLTHITTGHMPGKKGAFQPMNVNFGLFPEMEAPRKGPNGERLRGAAKTRAKKRLMTARALADHDAWRTGIVSQAAE
jgi:methylenetetrahydrofolate--tRNA-(uracil-5-)-methyltransferase